MSANKGGLAFPMLIDGVDPVETCGMTLRDYFAAKAMQGLLAQSEGGAFESNCGIGAAYAYRMAEAMLKVREL